MILTIFEWLILLVPFIAADTTNCTANFLTALPEQCFCISSSVECESLREGHIQQLQIAFSVPNVLNSFSLRQFNMDTLPLHFFGNIDAQHISINNGVLASLRPPGARDFDTFFDGLRSTREITIDNIHIENSNGWENFLREGQDTLQTIYLSGKELKLTKLWNNFAARLSANLRNIAIFGVGIETVGFRALSCLKCEDIDLSDNVISELSADVFNGSTKLERLYLRYNQLISLPDQVFEGLTKLNFLDLVGNPLNQLSATPFMPLPSDMTLLLRDNEISCSCSFDFLLRFKQTEGNICLMKSGTPFAWNSYLKKKCKIRA